METPKPVLLIDLSILMHASWHVSVDGPVSTAFEGTIGAVHRCVGLYPDALVAVCLDSKTNWRKALAPTTYKIQREKLPSSFYAIFDKVKERLRADGRWLVEAEGYESDDVIATLATEASKRGHAVVIASSDKDLTPLLALPDSSMLRTHDWSVWRAANVVEKYGIEPEGMPDLLALMGDKSDGIEGARGVGTVTAKTLLLQHFSIEELYAKIDELKGSNTIFPTKTPEAAKIATPAVLQSLYDNRDKVMLARKLVELKRDAPVTFDALYERRDPKPLLPEDDTMASLDDDTDLISDVREPKEEAKPDAPKATPEAGSPPSSAAASTAPTDAAPSAAATSTETALVVAEGVEYIRQLEPRSGQGALALGKVLYESRLFTRFPTPQAITAVIMRGRELGLGALVSLDVFHAIDTPNGLRLALHAHLIVALVQERSECEFFRYVKGDNTFATYEAKRRGDPSPVTHTYTIQDAVDAGLCGLAIVPRIAPQGQKDARGNWDKRRAEMIRKTCAVQLARIVFPSAALGLYSTEEFGVDE